MLKNTKLFIIIYIHALLIILFVQFRLINKIYLSKISTINKIDCFLFFHSGLYDLRNKNVNEIAEIIKAHKENKQNNLSKIDKAIEIENIKQMKKFAESQGECFNMCRMNLKERFKKDLEQYKKFNNNNLNFDENNVINLEKKYNNLEKELCFDACSKKYKYLFNGIV